MKILTNRKYNELIDLARREGRFEANKALLDHCLKTFGGHENSQDYTFHIPGIDFAYTWENKTLAPHFTLFLLMEKLAKKFKAL